MGRGPFRICTCFMFLVFQSLKSQNLSGFTLFLGTLGGPVKLLHAKVPGDWQDIVIFSLECGINEGNLYPRSGKTKAQNTST